MSGSASRGIGATVRVAFYALWVPFVAVTAVLGGLVLLAPDLITFGLILLVVPGLVLMVLPLAALYLGTATLFALPLAPFARGWELVIAPPLTLVAAFVVPWWINAPVSGTLAALQAGDTGLRAVPIEAGQSVALWRDRTERGERPIACGSLCLRLLYQGEVGSVYAVGWASRREPDRLRATRWFIEPAAACPQTRLWSGPRWSDEAEGATVLDRVRLRIAQGDCLANEPVPQFDGGVDGWLAHTVERKPARPRNDTRLFDPAIAAERLAVYDGRGLDSPPLVQLTEVHAEPLAAPLALFMLNSNVVDVRMGWVRAPIDRDAWSEDLFAAWQAVLGEAVTLPGGTGEAVAPGGDGTAQLPELRRLLDAALASTDASPAGFALVEAYVDALVATEALPPDDADRLARLLLDPRVRRFGALARLVHTVGSQADSLAQPLLTRLTTGDPEADRHVLDQLARAVERLSPGAIAAHADLLRTLAADPVRRRLAADALVRLADLGPEAAPVLLEVVRAGHPGEGELHQDLLVAGFEGLCRLDAAGTLAAPEAMAYVDRRLRQNTGRNDLLADVFDVLLTAGEGATLRARIAGSPLEQRLGHHERRLARHPDQRCEG